MKTKLHFLLLLFIIGIYSAKAKYTSIPDVNFEQALIDQGIDSGVIDHKVLTANISGLTDLDVSGSSIAYLTGIQDFVALTNLYCEFNQLVSLDLSGLTDLRTLFCNSNQLTSLNVSGLTILKELDCYDNPLVSLNVGGLQALTYLDCQKNQLASLNVSGLTNLQLLYCNNNLLTNLNVNGLTALTTIDCRYNELTSLDVSGLTSLGALDCQKNQLTNLNVSGLTKLWGLICNENQLTSLDVRGLTNLGELICHFNPPLSCIQVDNVTTANAENQWYKDATASYSTNCALATSNPQITPHAVTVFPNPAKEVLNIKSNSMILQTEMYDTNGRTVLSSTQNSENVVLNISALANGLYLLKLTTDEGSSIHKIVKR
ncbi:T9SS type A sorting domain-containing protein [Flavobacterium psychrotolerans]|nr:T9SS type A sorting domain-containing protein [Flavobacterium psychrotolerans]